MMTSKKHVNNLTSELKERAKELSCLYKVQEVLNDNEKNVDDTFREIVRILPEGWQYPDICKAQIVYLESVFESEDFKKSKWNLKANIVVQDEITGTIVIYYTEKDHQNILDRS